MCVYMCGVCVYDQHNNARWGHGKGHDCVEEETVRRNRKNQRYPPTGSAAGEAGGGKWAGRSGWEPAASATAACKQEFAL